MSARAPHRFEPGPTVTVGRFTGVVCAVTDCNERIDHPIHVQPSVEDELIGNRKFNSFAEFINQHLDPDLDGEELESAVGQLEVYMEALAIFVVRNRTYRDLWRKAGWLSHIHHIRHKAARLMNTFWGQKDVPAFGADLDDAYDLMNYTNFFIRSYHEGNERGTLW